MASVTGKLKDFQLQPLTDRPRLRFVPTGPGVASTGLHADKTVFVNTFGTDGVFTVELAPTIGMFGKVRYLMIVEFLDSAGNVVGYSEWPHPFGVPAEGGNLATLALLSVDSDTVATSPTASTSTNDGVYAGFKYNTTTGDLYERRLR